MRVGATRAWAVLALALALAPRATAQEPVFRGAVDGVRIDALVTDNGRPVAGLGPTDFEVRDNGVLQEVDLVSLGDVPLSVVLALDLSASVSGERLTRLVRAGSAVLDALVPADRAALVTFNRAVVEQVPLTTSRDAVRRALEAAAPEGNTALNDAALAALLVGDVDASRTLVVIFSDGVDTASFSRAEQVLATAGRVNGVVYAVATSDESPFLTDLTRATGGRVLTIGRRDDPGAAFLEILREFRRRYVLTYTPRDVEAGGWHSLDIKVRRPGVKVQGRAGYVSRRR